MEDNFGSDDPNIDKPEENSAKSRKDTAKPEEEAAEDEDTPLANDENTPLANDENTPLANDENTPLANDEEEEELPADDRSDNLVYDSATGLPLDLVIAKPARPYWSPLIVAAIVHVHGSITPGYYKRHARSGAKEIFPGVRTDVSIALGDFQVPSILITGQLKTDRRAFRIFNLSIPINTAGFTYRHEKPVAEIKEILFPAESASYSSLNGVSLPTSPEAADVDMLSITVPRSVARFSLTRTFLREMQDTGGNYATIGEQFQDWAAGFASEDVLHLTLSRANPAEDEFLWPNLCQYLFPYNPFAAMIPEGVNIRDLTGANIVLPDADPTDTRPRPVPTTSQFFDQTHYFVSLLAGVADELRHDAIRATTGAATPSYAKFFELRSPWTEGEEEQIAKYGQVIADNAATEYLMVVEITPANCNLLGSVDDLVKVTTTGITAEYHAQPNPDDAQHIDRVAANLMTRFQDAVNHAETITLQQHLAALEAANQALQDGEPKITDMRQELDLDGAYDDAVYTVMRKAVSDFITRAMAAEYAAANPLDAAMSNIARCTYAVVAELRRQPGEEDKPYLERLRAWVRAHPAVNGENRHGTEGLTFHGRRITPPPGTTLHHALYHVSRPTQPGYPKAYKAPYLKVEFPVTPYPTAVKEFSATCFPTPAGSSLDEEANQAAAQIPANAVIVQVSVKPDTTTLTHEMKALHTMHKVRGETYGGVFWNYIRGFQDFPVEYHRNLLSVFPGLRDLALRTDVPPSLLSVLVQSKAGKVFMSGFPGAGKSHLLLIMAQCALRGPYCPRGNVNIEAAPVVAQLDEQTAVELEIALYGLDPQENFDNENLQLVKDTLTEAESTEEVQTTEKIARDQPPARKGFIFKAKPQITPSAARGGKPVQILWSAPANTLANNAVVLLIEAGVDAVRAYTFSSELANLLMPKQEKRLDLTPPNTRAPTERIFTDHRNEIFRQQNAQKSARNDPLSLSNQALQRIPVTDPRAVLTAQARELHQTDPHGFSLIKTEATKAASSMIEEVAKSVQVICCTPVAARTLGSNVHYVPSAIFSDESGRLTEAQFFILISHWPQTAVFIVGDPQQFSPVVPCKYQVFRTAKTPGKPSTTLWQDRFGAQREVSLLQRAEDNNAIDLYLRVNHRAHGSIINWPSRQFYGGEMIVAHANRGITSTSAQFTIMTYLQKYSPKIQFCGLFIDLQKMFETKVATSYSSTTSARFCVELAISLWRDVPIPRKNKPALRYKVLIITGYSVQAAAMRYMVNKISRNCVPEGAIQVRTIDDSPSHEAELVIVDFPRISGVGFLDERRRVNVACTRAHYCTIYVGNIANLEKSALLRSLINTHRKAYALVTLEKRPDFCDQCYNMGHMRRGCNAAIGEDTLRCYSCTRKNRNHSGRACPTPTFTAEFDYCTRIRPIDSIARDLLADVKVVEPAADAQHDPEGILAINRDRSDFRSGTRAADRDPRRRGH
ncbi:hypothetical protein ARSEF1564_004523 [Beauveria bassiana]